MGIRFKTVLPLIAALLVLASGSIPARAQSIKIAVFDPQRVSEETAEGKRIQQYLDGFRRTKQQELADKEKQVTDLQQRLNEQALSLSAEKRTAMELELQRKALDLNSSKDLAQRELQLEAAGAEEQFAQKLRLVIAQFGRDSEFGLIFDRGAVAWAADSIDVTTAVIDVFDKVFPASGE